MAKQRIIVQVAPDGAIHAETQGLMGDACLDYIETLEDLLDAETISSDFTDEYTETGTIIEHEVPRDLHQR